MAAKMPFVFLLALFAVVASGAETLDAPDIVKSCFNYMRGTSSVSTVNMTIHRPDWERHMTIEAWTKGESDCIFRIVAPPKDNGNGTLKKKHPKPSMLLHELVVDAVVCGALSEHLDAKSVKAAVKRFKSAFVDWNDLRVSLDEEVVEAIKARFLLPIVVSRWAK